MRLFKSSNLGATLLEIMLVLAIGAIVIVMSIRYYQSATVSRQAKALYEQIQAITAMADSLAQMHNGSFENVSNETLAPSLPGNGFNAPWGATITISGASATQYTVTVPSTPDAVCPLIEPRLTVNPKYANFSCGGGQLSYTFQSAQ